jgi:hypothetical protein
MKDYPISSVRIAKGAGGFDPCKIMINGVQVGHDIDNVNVANGILHWINSCRNDLKISHEVGDDQD